MRRWRALLLLGLVTASGAWADAAQAALEAGGVVLLLRHGATAPGIDDPPGFQLGDCATQRNLSDAGRAEAEAAGARLRAAGVSFSVVRASEWCRCRDTARLMAVGEVAPWEALNSVFARHAEHRARRTAELRAWVQAWRGPGNALLVTHGANIVALSGVSPGQGEGIVLRPGAEGFEIVGRLQP